MEKLRPASVKTTPILSARWAEDNDIIFCGDILQRLDPTPGGMVIMGFDHCFKCNLKSVGKNKRARILVTHPYFFELAKIESFTSFAKERNLDMHIHPASWYFPGNSVMIVFTLTEDGLQGVGLNHSWLGLVDFTGGLKKHDHNVIRTPEKAKADRAAGSTGHEKIRNRRQGSF